MADHAGLNGQTRADNAPLAPWPTVEAAERWLTPADIAERLRLSRSFVYGEIKKGKLRASLFGRMPRVTERDFADYLSKARGAP